jgi:4-aminobutyrate aminotransferase-like enzyme
MKWNWLMIAPPLIITRDEIDQGIGLIDEILSEVDCMI